MPSSHRQPLPWRRLAADPRHFQIAVLGGLLVYGMTALDFGLSWERIAVTIGTALGTQRLAERLRPGQSSIDLRSPLISSLSLCLILRTGSLWVAALASVLAIGSKYVIRRRGKHVFNPANFGIAVVTLTTSQAWVSPGQWGSVALLGFALAGLGGLVVYRAARSDVSYAFLGSYASFLLARAAWLGDPWQIPLHQLANGALLLFAFFMVSDPKTTPNARTGRLVHGALIAAVALIFRFHFHEPDGLLWSLLLVSPLVPVWDAVFGGALYQWGSPRTGNNRPGGGRAESRRVASRLSSAPGPAAPRPFGPLPSGLRPSENSAVKGTAMTRKRHFIATTTLGLGLSLLANSASAFCGFYVAKADAQLFNDASQVVLVRDDDRTVITMASDYQGEPEEFALVVPVPTVLQEGQIHVTEQSILDHLDAYTSPRLVEYFDSDPCMERKRGLLGFADGAGAPAPTAQMELEEDLGVTIEAKYTVGEYDILILSAEESGGLETWLRQNGYRIPDGAGPVLGSYIKQGMKFFVAKVNLGEKDLLGIQNLRPIQVAFESPKFMLPLRLGTVNSRGTQEMFVYALTRTGRVESVNYRTVRLPSDLEIPEYIEEDFGGFYRAMFDEQWNKEGRNVVFLEYAWDMGWCDPCAADPLSSAQLRELGAYWVTGNESDGGRGRGFAPPQGPQNVFVTRLHVRYDGKTFPEDLVFRETGDRGNYQGRYVLRHPFSGRADCPAAREYFRELKHRQQREAETLASLTGWELADILRDMDLPNSDPGDEDGPWWKTMWR
ncbi:MAG: DUF2330 domain-containing protein [Candidatus Eisenbacteria bacterium]